MYLYSGNRHITDNLDKEIPLVLDKVRGYLNNILNDKGKEIKGFEVNTNTILKEDISNPLFFTRGSVHYHSAVTVSYRDNRYIKITLYSVIDDCYLKNKIILTLDIKKEEVIDYRKDKKEIYKYNPNNFKSISHEVISVDSDNYLYPEFIELLDIIDSINKQNRKIISKIKFGIKVRR